MPKRIGSGGWNNFRLLKIEAKPLQSEHSNQSHCEADGYISIRARFLANAVLSTTTLRKHTLTQPARRSCAGLDCLQHRSDLMVKCTTLTTSAGNLIGDNQNSITAGAHSGSTLLEKVMKTIGKIAIGSAVAFSALAFTAAPGSADSGGPAIIPHGHYCASYTQAGIDCSFTSYAQCEATASGQSAECYGNTPADDQDPWNARAQQFSRNTRAQQFSRNTRAQQFSRNTRAQQFSWNTRVQ